MSVDKFGLMGDQPTHTTRIINPIHKYAANLDDLENVEGFNEPGREDIIYAFQLTGDGIYKRHKIDKAVGLLLDNDGKVDKPMLVVWNNDHWLTLPHKYDWDIDIKLHNEKISTKGNDHNILKIFNSGRMMTSLIPNKNYKENTIVGFVNNEYYITSGPKDRTILSFKTEFVNERKLLEEVPNGSTLIINGYISDTSDQLIFFINGLKIKWNAKEQYFTIIIQKNKDRHVIKTFPPGLETELDEGAFGFNQIFVWDNYLVNRVRFTQLPVTENEIKFL